MWGGRFTDGPSPELAALSRSMHFDWRLAPYDLLPTRAHAGVLRRAGLLDRRRARRSLAALDSLAAQSRDGTFVAAPDDEDVHTAHRARAPRAARRRTRWQAARRAQP